MTKARDLDQEEVISSNLGVGKVGHGVDVSGVRERSKIGEGIVRRDVRDLGMYIPGKAHGTNREKIFKLSQNESPFQPLPGVLEAARNACDRLGAYPENALAELRRVLATDLDVSEESVIVGAGSVGVIQQLLQAVLRHQEEVVFAWRSFDAYRILTEIAGGVPVTIPLNSLSRHDMPGIAGAITPQTRVVILCSPNNPTGTVVHRDEFRVFMRSVPSDVLVMIDEAYHEFVRSPDALDGMEAQRSHKNVVVLRTFSKAHGLAGLRVGYGIAAPEVAEAANKTRLPFSVSSIAQSAAVASLGLGDEVARRVEKVVNARESLIERLHVSGWRIGPSDGNFVWLPLGADTTAFARYCLDANVLVRPFGEDGVRVTVGSADAIDKFLELADAWTSGRGR